MFEAEINTQLWYKKHSSEGDNTGNSRNGYSQTKFANSELKVPRDRNDEYKPNY